MRSSRVLRWAVVSLVFCLPIACGKSGGSGKKKLPPAQVGNPSPAHGAMDVPLTSTLSWGSASGATSYDVYFGTSAPGTFRGNQSGTTFDPGPLTRSTQYTWRIDALNSAGTTGGIPWTFTTEPPPRGEDHTLVIDNVQSPTSQAIAAYYRGLRPATRLFSIDTAPVETVNRTTFDNEILAPIENFLTTGGIVDDIWYIVTTKGVPLRISGNSGAICISDERASVDSELAHMFNPWPLPGKISNPYYNASMQFSRPAYNMYLVCRLTGYETDNDGDMIPDDVKDLIDRGFNPEPAATAKANGKFVLDQWPPRGVTGNDWMQFADTALTMAGFNSMLDTTNVFLTGETDLIGYCSWGSNDGANNTPPYLSMHTYLNGAIVTTYVSTNARSFQTGTMYGQSLAADLIQEGVTGANGHVYEPCLDAVSRPHILFDRYVQGFNLAESYYTSISYLSWMNVIVGDPICSPWAP